MKEGYGIANVVSNNELLNFTLLEDGRYLISNITEDIEITIVTMIEEKNTTKLYVDISK